MNVSEFKRLPLLAILRGGDTTIIGPLVDTVVEAGLRTLEIAMNTPGAAAMIERAVETADGRLTIGAGTVTTRARLDDALAAGASFIVLPTCEAPVMEACAARAIPVFPGALTPNEIHTAWSAGATMVKVFPAKVFGPDYLREIKGPFEDIELLACGGISADNMAAYFEAGASAVAFGGSLFKPQWLRPEELPRIRNGVRALVEAHARVKASDRGRP
jgi:2-dehydro-3-deoxyphosphogluconate aldolase/(4S)-4-hydroxy-2-oxoglutarate aldolase